MKSKDFTGKFSPANISEGIDNKVEEGDLMYINPEVFWNSSEETALIGFIKSKEPQIIEAKDKKKIRKTVNIFRGEVVKEKKVINGKEEEAVYQFGEIEFNGKNWKTLEKGPIPSGVSYETIYKNNKAEYDKKNRIECLW